MCAHDLYYAVFHALLFLEEDATRDGQGRMLRAMQREMCATDRYRDERDGILRAFIG
jgi:hypothetical protein